MAIDPEDKLIKDGRIEKYILRKAFDTTDEPETTPYLPSKILWRQKEQFSDGVGYGWIDALKDHAELHVSDEMMKHPRTEWGDDVPDSKEAYWYRTMFDEFFPPSCASTVMRWTPTWSEQSDPSGRYVTVRERHIQTLIQGQGDLDSPRKILNRQEQCIVLVRRLRLEQDASLTEVMQLRVLYLLEHCKYQTCRYLACTVIMSFLRPND